MLIAFLQSQVPQPKGEVDYKKTYLEFDVRDIHPIDQMEMHKQTREMIFSTVTNTAMSLSKLQVTLANVRSQLNMEKDSSFSKGTRIKTLEYLVIKLGYDPTNVNATEELIKKKNVDIATLRKQLKLPATKDPLAKEIEEIEVEKAYMMKLILEQITQLKQMERNMEKWIKESKKPTKKATPLEALPMTSIPTTIAVSTSKGDAPDKLASTLENMKL